MPFLSPNQQCQSTEGKNITFHGLAYPKLTWRSSSFCLWPLITSGYLGGGLPCLSSALWCQYPNKVTMLSDENYVKKLCRKDESWVSVWKCMAGDDEWRMASGRLLVVRLKRGRNFCRFCWRILTAVSISFALPYRNRNNFFLSTKLQSLACHFNSDVTNDFIKTSLIAECYVGILMRLWKISVLMWKNAVFWILHGSVLTHARWSEIFWHRVRSAGLHKQLRDRFSQNLVKWWHTGQGRHH